MKKLSKTFIIASSLPAVILALGGLAIGAYKNGSTYSFAFLWIAISMVFGLFNVATKLINVKRTFGPMFIAGAVLGLGLSSIGVFVLNLPEHIYGLHGSSRYVALLIAPFFYGMIWSLIVFPLEKLFAIENNKLSE
jgi:hypothetical protein